MNEAQTLPDLGFTEEFFAAYGQEIASVDVEVQAQAALDGILTTEKEDGTIKTFQEIKGESERFFSNPLIMESAQLLSMAAQRWVSFCEAHGHDRTSDMNSGLLGSIFDTGTAQREKTHEHRDHEDAQLESGHAHDSSPTKDGKKKKKKRREKDGAGPSTKRFVLPAMGSLGLKNMFKK